MKIESKIGKSVSTDRQIYGFITNFHNFKELLPADRVSGWEASEEKCSFQVDPLGRTGLLISEKEPHKMVKMVSDPEFSSYQFTIWIQIKAAGEQDTRIKVTIEPRVSKMLLPMVKLPLKKLADTIVDRMEAYDFSSSQS